MFKTKCGNSVVNEVWEVVIGQEQCTVQTQSSQTQTGQI